LVRSQGNSLSCGLIIFLGAAERRATATARQEATQRAELQRVVQQQHAELRQMIDGTPFLLTRCSRDLRYRFVSPAYAKLLGRTPQEVAGQPIREIMGEKGLTVIMPHIQRVLAGEIAEYEADVPFAGVGIRNLRVVYTPDRDAEGAVIGWFGSILDLTDKKKTERSLRRSLRRQEAIYQLVDKLQCASSLEEIYRAGLDGVLQGLRCDRVSILLFDENAVMRFVAADGLSQAYRDAVDGHSPWTPETRDAAPISIADIGLSDLEEGLKSTIQNEGIGALAFIPLMEAGKVAGKFMSYFNKPHVFEAAELETAMTIGRQISSALQRHRAETKLRVSEQRALADLEATRKLYELGTGCLDESRHLTECLNDVLETALFLTDAARGNVQLLDAESGKLVIVAQKGFEAPFLTFFAEVESGEPAACGHAMRAAERVVVEDVTESEIFFGSPARQILFDAGVRAVQSMPLFSSTGRVLGMISTHFDHPHRPNDRELGFLDLLARQAAD
jgi:PAS domain S-box-containing protein